MLRGCETLIKFTNKPTDEVILGMKISGCIEAVVVAMQFHRNDVDVQRLGIQVMRNLSKDPRLMDAMVVADCTTSIAQAIRFHAEDDTISREAVLIFATMTTAGGAAKQAVLHIHDVVYMTINTMLALSNNKKLQVDGMIVISGSSEDAEEKDCIFNLGGIEAVAQAMSSSQDDNKVQVLGVKIFHRLFVDGRRAQSPDSVLMRAVISATILAMETSVHLPNLQEDAAALLWVLCSRDETLVSPALEFGALNAILLAAQVHADVASMQERCFDALHSLAVNEKSCSLIASNGGITTVLDGMSKHVGERIVLDAGISCLRTLLAFKVELPEIAKEGGLRIFMLAMSTHPEQEFLHENVLATASALLSDMTVNGSEAFVNDPNVKVIINSMVTHPKLLEVQKWGCICLYHMSKGSEKNRAVINQRSVQVVDVLTNASEEFPQECLTLTSTILEVIMHQRSKSSPMSYLNISW